MVVEFGRSFIIRSMFLFSYFHLSILTHRFSELLLQAESIFSFVPTSPPLKRSFGHQTGLQSWRPNLGAKGVGTAETAFDIETCLHHRARASSPPGGRGGVHLDHESRTWTQIFVELLILFFSFLVKHGGMLSLMNGFLDLESALADCISFSV